MQRSTLDTLISSTALIITIVLLLASAALFFAHNFIHGQVTTQLGSQSITFPAKDSKSFTSLPQADQQAMNNDAGQQVLTGAQAEVFADHYIAVHLKSIGGGETYSQLSSDAMKDPSNTVLPGKIDTVFKGETLRGMLLNAYAFDTMAVIALLAAYSTLIAGILLLVLAILGFLHAKKLKNN